MSKYELKDRQLGKKFIMNREKLPSFTTKQGQYLAFIYYYTKVNGIAPAESDFERYFGTASSSVHAMILTLKKKGLITSIAGKSRTIRLLIGINQLPEFK